MYYEEKEINGILCFRLTPTGSFKQCSIEHLTNRINELRHRLNDLSEELEDLRCDYNDLLDRQ